MKKIILIFMMGIILLGCGTKNELAGDNYSSSALVNKTLQKSISEEMAYEGVSNYCHDVYDWSIAEDNPDTMYLRMGEETESEYQVIFRSYTGAFVYFYVDKLSGTTRLIEYVPNLAIEEEAGIIDLYDYLKADDK